MQDFKQGHSIYKYTREAVNQKNHCAIRTGPLVPSSSSGAQILVTQN